MPRCPPHRILRRGLIFRAAALATVTLLLPALLGGALATPATGVAPTAPFSYGPEIEPLASYDPQSTCDPTLQPGVRAFRHLILATYPFTRTIDSTRACDVGGRSEHKDGRAWDWGVRADVPAEKQAADEMLAWLLATDEHGNRWAMARRLGVMYVIWNDRMWGAWDAEAGWQPYGGASPHTDHVHISFSRDGAVKTTSFWNGSPVRRLPTCPTLDRASPQPMEIEPAGAFVPLTPSRLLDTRAGQGVDGDACRLGPHGGIDLQVTGRGGVPESGVAAVALNLTGTGPTDTTWVAAYPTGVAPPGTSSLNLAAGQTRASLVVVPVGRDGRVRLRNGAGSVDLVVDVLGYYPTRSSAVAADSFHPLTPIRALDTRVDDAPLRPGETRRLPLAGRFGLPRQGVAGVVVNITVTEPTAGGFVTAFPAHGSAGGPPPTTSTVNVAAGQTVPNRTIVALSDDGVLALYNRAGTAHIVVDLVGWYDEGGTPVGTAETGVAAPAGVGYTPLAPARILDTRSGQGGLGTLGPDESGDLLVAGRGGVPEGARAVVLTLTATEPSAQTFVTAWPHGTRQPLASDLNVTPGRTAANLVVVPLGPDGRLSLYNNAGTVDLVADVLGYFA